MEYNARSDAIRVAECNSDELESEDHLGTGKIQRPSHVYQEDVNEKECNKSQRERESLRLAREKKRE